MMPVFIKIVILYVVTDISDILKEKKILYFSMAYFGAVMIYSQAAALYSC